MPPAPPQGGGQGDNSNAMLWGVAAVFAAIGMIWFTFKDYIVAAYLTLKLWEVDLLNWFTGGYFYQLRGIIVGALHDPSKVSFQNLMLIGDGVGDWLRYPFIFILLILAVVIYLGNATRVYRRQYSMRDLASLEKNNWPQISPVMGLDLIKADLDIGPWAMAMTPMQFCKRYRLLEEVRVQRREGMTRKDFDKTEVVLKKGNANKLFALQLGALWKGIDKLPPHALALFAVFAARINADSGAAANLISQFNHSPRGKLNLSGVNEVIKKHIDTKPVQKIMQSHAYVVTLMASMLESAREDGVQASADFLWLKPLDRKLWYTLNTVGRQTPFVEVAGIFAHWLAEKEAARKLMVPMVEEATKALEIALKEVVYRPDEK